MDDLQGRTAFVTGAGSGIGLGVARAFARAGMKVGMADFDEAALANAAAEVGQLGKVSSVALDIRDRDAFLSAADKIEAEFGDVSVLINNAGVWGMVTPKTLSYEAWDWIVGTNLTGCYNGIQTFVPRMVARGTGGHVLSTASGAGLAAPGAGFLYHTSKFGIVGMSEALRFDLEPYGIGVSVLCPGPVATNGAKNSLRTPPGVSWDEDTEPVRQMFTNLTARGRTIDEVGAMVLDAVEHNKLYVHTDAVMADRVKTRTEQILAAMPES